MTGKAIKARAAGVLAGLCCALPAAAQEDGGGQLLTFGLSQRLSYDSNADLVPGGGDSAFLSLTDLSFAFTDTTRIERFSLTGNTGLRLGDTDAPTIATPRFAFSYGRTSADATLDFGGSWSRSEIDRLATLDDFTDADGRIELPVDFDLLDPRIAGTRTASRVNVGVTAGRTRPLSYSLRAGLGRITYDGDAGDVLSDSQSLTLGGSVSARLDEVTSASLSLTYTRFEEDGLDATERLGGSLSWQRDRPTGALGFSVNASEVDGGTRIDLGTSRSFRTPLTQLTFGAGLSGVDGDDWTVTGRIDASHALPDDGAVTFGARRSFATAADGTDRRVTDVSATYGAPLDALSRVSSGFSYLDVSETDGRVRTLNLSAAYSRQLTPDWALSAGVTLTERRETGLERARNESVFLSLERSFTFRP